MSSQIYISGQFYTKEEAAISVFDHGLLYGDGVFEGIRSYEGMPFRLDMHIKRLFLSAGAIRLAIPLSKEELANAIVETLRVNVIQNGYIRVVVTRGPGSLGIDPRKTSNPKVIIIAEQIEVYPPALYEKGLSIITAATTRNHANALSPKIKSLNYLNNILAKFEAIDAGADEALMLNSNGEVTECTVDNIFIIRQGILQTPPPNSGILEGITREVVIELATNEAKYQVLQAPLTRYDIYSADECFLTGTAIEIIPIVRCDNRVIGMGQPGPITRNLREWFTQLTLGTCSSYRNPSSL